MVECECKRVCEQRVQELIPPVVHILLLKLVDHSLLRENFRYLVDRSYRAEMWEQMLAGDLVEDSVYCRTMKVVAHILRLVED